MRYEVAGRMILIVGGYANAGKSTFLDVAGRHNVRITSTSQTLDDISWEVYKAINPKTDFSRYEFVDSLKQKRDDLLGFDSRAFKIAVAENIVVPVLGRDAGIVAPTVLRVVNPVRRIAKKDGDAGIVAPTVLRKASAFLKANQRVIIESIGGEEWRLLERHLEDYKYKCVNIRRPGFEKPGVDIRRLLPGALTLENNSPTIEEWKSKCDLFVREFLAGG